MAFVQGLVSVSDDGTVSYVPDDATNCAKMYYLMLIGVNSTAKMQSKVSGGPATWIPPKPTISNPPTPTERAAFATWQASNPVMVPPPPPTTVTTTHTIAPTPQIKQKTAEMANGFAQIASFLLANAVVTVTIANDASGDGLQVGHNPGDPTTHPASPKTLTGTLT